MKVNPVAWVMLSALLAASACARTTAVGASGRGQSADAADAGADVDVDADADAGGRDGAISQDADAAPASAADLCTSSGGTITTGSCCANGVDSFPDSCAVGACGCSPASSRSIPICACPTGVGCFAPGFGCVGPPGACTEAMDLSCDEDTAATTPRGHCVTGGRCLCSPGATLTSTGKCL
jgi:hypothetical protein